MTKRAMEKDNDLLEAWYKLTPQEQRLLTRLLLKVRPKDEASAVYTVTAGEFKAVSGTGDEDAYGHFKALSERLMRKPLIIGGENGALITNWLSGAEYVKARGKMAFSFDLRLKPYLITLRDRLALYGPPEVVQFNSVYAVRMHQLLKQYTPAGERLFTLRELRALLGIEDGRYPLYPNFKQKVLSVAYRELKEKSALYFEYEEIKQNKKVVKIKCCAQTRRGD